MKVWIVEVKPKRWNAVWKKLQELTSASDADRHKGTLTLPKGKERPSKSTCPKCGCRTYQTGF